MHAKDGKGEQSLLLIIEVLMKKLTSEDLGEERDRHQQAEAALVVDF